MTLDREGRVRSKLVVEKQETLDLLQRDQRNLERAFAATGLKAEEGSLEFSLRDDRGTPSGGSEREARGDGRGGNGRSQGQANAAPVDSPAVNLYARLAAARGGVDIRI